MLGSASFLDESLKQSSSTLSCREIVEKAYQDINVDFMCTLNFAFYVQYHSFLNSLTSVVSRLSTALQLIRIYGDYYRQIGPDMSQKRFTGHPEIMRHHYELMQHEFSQHFKDEKEYYVSRALKFMELSLIDDDVFGLGELLLLMHARADYLLRECHIENGQLGSKLRGDTHDKEKEEDGNEMEAETQ